jgi:hypothetical protein
MAPGNYEVELVGSSPAKLLELFVVGNPVVVPARMP